MDNKFLQIRYQEARFTITDICEITGLGVGTVSETLSGKRPLERVSYRTFKSIMDVLFTPYEQYQITSIENSGAVEKEFPVEVYAYFKDRQVAEVLNELTHDPFDETKIEIKAGTNGREYVFITLKSIYGSDRTFKMYDADLLKIVKENQDKELIEKVTEWAADVVKNQL